MSEGQREPFKLTTTREWVSEELHKLWKASRKTEPDDDKISNALEETVPADDDQGPDRMKWFEAARKWLAL